MTNRRDPLPLKSQVDDFKENLAKNMLELETNLDHLPERNQDFVSSLIKGYKKYGTLTEKQLPYACMYWLTVSEEDTPNLRLRDVPEPKSLTVLIDTTHIYSLFQRALESFVQQPKLTIPLSDHKMIIVISRKVSANLLCLANPDGWKLVAEIKPSAATFTEFAMNNAEYKETIRQLLENPIHYLAKEGKRIGNCCFCARTLLTKESLAVGYGPICADKFGLPWGEPQTELEHSI